MNKTSIFTDELKNIIREYNDLVNKLEDVNLKIKNKENDIANIEASAGDILKIYNKEKKTVENLKRIKEALERKIRNHDDRESVEKCYFENFLGLDYSEDHTDKWIVFDKDGELKGIEEFDNSNQEESLRSRGLYAHRLSSFYYRSIGWYSISLLEQLKTLGWELKNNELAPKDLLW